MARPDCPSCGSSQVVPVLHGVHRTNTLPLGEADGLALGSLWHAVDDWVCGDCGNRWPDSEEAVAGTEPAGRMVSFPNPQPSADPQDLAPNGDQAEEWREVESVQGASVPALLREARERRGESLDEVARATNIWIRYLRALEEDASLDTFPGTAYAAFFLREYAQHLGLDPEPLLRAHRTRHAAEETVAETPVEPLVDPRHRTRVLGRTLGVISALLLVAVVLVPQIVRGRTPEPSASSTGLGGSSLSTAVSHTRPRPPDLTAAHPARRLVVVIRPSAACWVRAVADGRTIMTRTLAPGERTTFQGRSTVGLVLGNAGGVSVTVNGAPVRTGEPGEVVRLTFRLHDGVVRTVRA